MNPPIGSIPYGDYLEGQDREKRKEIIQKAIKEGKAVEFTTKEGLRKVVTEWIPVDKFEDDLVCSETNGKSPHVCWTAKAYAMTVIDRL